MGIDEIDTLLERYLLLLDEYTTLRANLNALQAGIYQNIARANFSAERGMRFGQNHYDDRVQASRKLEISLDDNGCAVFKVAGATLDQTAPQKCQTEAAAVGAQDPAQEETDANVSHNGKEPLVHEDKAPRRKNPLQWFGLLAPLPLRQAQAQNVKAVEDIIPRLVTVNAEMEQVEIAVRRARKKRGKAEATAKKHQEEVHRQEEATA
ncbi:hypothetical protein PFICI_12172 [Pestalotiopsis fici W106-1]|uniref:Vacuolar ATPase assembly protein VMA22 n=1 Tax=Pestalotiopsis fici (strain W106-1 / CGMCC3.15140) TaxID=1229662 RepID=W3WSF0_PESFW|nr:uncharacterized protein PFICI_12172 [Pestalotiopsis fici W106-1]ETS76785.1 hypothetical protein PFICI_12172 [Pestalotiopsis fici W106-1]